MNRTSLLIRFLDKVFLQDQGKAQVATFYLLPVNTCKYLRSIGRRYGSPLLMAKTFFNGPLSSQPG